MRRTAEQQLRADGLIELQKQALTVLNPDGLTRLARYQANSLHLVRVERGDRNLSARVSDLAPPADRG